MYDYDDAIKSGSDHASIVLDSINNYQIGI